MKYSISFDSLSFPLSFCFSFSFSFSFSSSVTTSVPITFSVSFFKHSNISLQILVSLKLHISLYFGHFNSPLNPSGLIIPPSVGHSTLVSPI